MGEQTLSDLDDVLTTEEAAELCGRSTEAVRKALQRGSLRGKHVSRYWITTRADVLSWMAWGPLERRRHKGTGRYMDER